MTGKGLFMSSIPVYLGKTTIFLQQNISSPDAKSTISVSTKLELLLVGTGLVAARPWATIHQPVPTSEIHSTAKYQHMIANIAKN